jgi:integrase
VKVTTRLPLDLDAERLHVVAARRGGALDCRLLLIYLADLLVELAVALRHLAGVLRNRSRWPRCRGTSAGWRRWPAGVRQELVWRRVPPPNWLSPTFAFVRKSADILNIYGIGLSPPFACFRPNPLLEYGTAYGPFGSAERGKMARASNRLTAIAVARTTKPGFYADGHSLYLRIGPTGSKSWVFRYRLAGRLHDMGLGPLHTVSLADARSKALDLRRQRLDGTDPLTVKREAAAKARVVDAKAMTFKAAAETYIAAHQAGWRNAKHRAQWPSTLETYAYPTFGALPVQAIDTGLVMKILEPIWTTKPETASRVRGRIESVLDWAAARDYRQGENPARWRGHLENLLPQKSKIARVEHHAALPYTEIADFMTGLRQQGGVAARALELAILTAARTGEVIGARWGEFNLAERLWIVSGERMKASREHRVPLSDAALAIVERMAKSRVGEAVFPGAKAAALSDAAMTMLLRRMGRGEITVHGFRSTFSDWCAERTNFPTEVREMALAHAVGDKVEAAYRRGDLFAKRRQLMQAWAKFCAAAPVATGEVVPLRA